MPGPLTLGEIASRLGGRVAGDAQIRISQVGSLETAAPGQISFLSHLRHHSRLTKGKPLTATGTSRAAPTAPAAGWWRSAVVYPHASEVADQRGVEV